jgi:two-component sensor histidine kinase
MVCQMPKPGTRVFSGLPALSVEPMTPKAFLLAAAGTAVALFLRWAIGLLDPGIPPFPTFLASVLLTAILAGIAAGALASILGLAAAWLTFSASTPASFTPTSVVLYVLTSLVIIWVAEQYRSVLRRLQENEDASDRQIALVVAENEILADIAADAPLAETLERLARSIEDYSGGRMLASLLLMDADGRHLRHGAAPSLPAEYSRAIDGGEIGPAAGSCGTAAFRKEPVYVSDIEHDPLWADYKALALPHGLRACWSTPIFSSTNSVLGTFALYHREQRSPSDQEKEIVGLLTRIAAIAVEHEQDRQQRQLLVSELTHRVKNLLSVVLSIAANTIRPRTEEAGYKAFEDRLVALSKTQELLTQTHWSSVDLRELVTHIAVQPFAGKESRFSLQGPSTHFPARLTLPFALSLHELCTNAAKYGALKNEQGRILIDWGYTGGEGGANRFFFRWTETEGPPVSPPSRQGFGSRMIQKAFTSNTGGVANVEYRPEGLVCEISLSSDLVSPLVSERPADPRSPLN